MQCPPTHPQIGVVMDKIIHDLRLGEYQIPGEKSFALWESV
jgi:hypothetical protein